MDGGAQQISMPALRERYLPELSARLASAIGQNIKRQELAQQVKALLQEWLVRDAVVIEPLMQRDLVTSLINALLARQALSFLPPLPSETAAAQIQPAAPKSDLEKALEAEPTAPKSTKNNALRSTVVIAKEALHPHLMERIDASAAAKMTREDLSRDLSGIIDELLIEKKMPLSLSERQELVVSLLDDMLGLGPLEPLLADEAISEIMVNGAKQVWIEQKGKLTLTDTQFRDNSHVLSVAQRIVT